MFVFSFFQTVTLDIDSASTIVNYVYNSNFTHKNNVGREYSEELISLLLDSLAKEAAAEGRPLPSFRDHLTPNEPKCTPALWLLKLSASVKNWILHCTVLWKLTDSSNLEGSN